MGLKVLDVFEKLQEIVRIAETYDIICGIRGPDSENISLKAIFTARLRYLVAGGDIGGGITRPSEKVNLHVLADAIEELSKADYHYLEHVDLAFSCLAEIFERKDEHKKAEECLFLSSLATELREIAKISLFLDRQEISKDVALWEYNDIFDRLNKLLDRYSNFVTDEYPEW